MILRHPCSTSGNSLVYIWHTFGEIVVEKMAHMTRASLVDVLIGMATSIGFVLACVAVAFFLHWCRLL